MGFTLTKPKNPATPKQLAYIQTLMTKVYGENVDEAFCVFIETEPDTKAASAKIDSLRGILDGKVIGPKTSTPSTPTHSVPNGIHYAHGIVYRVRESKAGHQYAERLLTQIEREENEGKAWLYEGRKPLAGLSADTILTFQQAKAYGKAYGICADCGKLLSNPDSVEAGIGPVCASKW